VRPLGWICAWLAVGAALTANQPADAAVINLTLGTGFFVSKQGHVLTNFHVVDSCRQVTVQSGSLSQAARVVALDVANDLALLATSLRPEGVADWRHTVQIDEPVVVYGFPVVADRTLHGKVLGLTGWHTSVLLYTEAGLEPGMSGSAVIDGAGLVIGITVGSRLKVGTATSSAAAGALLDAHGVTHPEARETKPLPKAEVIDKAKAISVKVTCQSSNQGTDVCRMFPDVIVPSDKIIEACDREIASGKLSGEALRLMYERRAEAHLKKYHLDDAMRDCDAALKVAEDSNGFRCRAAIYGAMGDFGRAVAELDEAIRSFPKDIIALSKRAAFYGARTDFDRARADLDQAIEIDPDFPLAILLRGAIFEIMQQHDRAVANFDRAIAIYNDLLKLYSAPVLRVELLTQRGDAYNVKGDRDRAIADFDEVIRLDPNNSNAFHNRANAYNAKGDRDRAIADYDKAIGINPGDAGAFYNRGNAYYAKGDRDRAMADYDRAILLNPIFDTPQVRQRRGVQP
jgi:tetratricopeptide (TPR) repeat protein